VVCHEWIKVAEAAGCRPAKGIMRIKIATLATPRHPQLAGKTYIKKAYIKLH